MIDEIARCGDRIVKVEGPARSGKTEALVRRCVALLEEGCDPSSIFVETSSSMAAQAFRKRLHSAMPEDKADLAGVIVVSTAQDACVAVLDTPSARQATGRVPRLLNKAEYAFFLEDMKTLGQQVRRLRKMLEFFYARWAALEPEDSWLLAGEEADVLRNLHSFLVLREAMLPEETAAITAAYLKSDEGSAARHVYSHVLCDDFQNMSHAEQTAICMLAADQLIVVGNPNETIAAHTAYPYAQGFVSFDSLRRSVRTFMLQEAFGDARINKFADALTHHGDMDPSFSICTASQSTGHNPCTLSPAAHAAGIIAVKWNTPEEEFDGITKYLRTLVDENPGSDESRICVVVPNKRWARTAERVLKHRGFAVSMAGSGIGMGGDPRDLARCKAMVAYTKLNLLAHPEDIVAWRSWCGFGNYLTNSDAWSKLQDYAETHGMSLYEALTEISASDEEVFLRADALTEAYHSGIEFIHENTGRKGFALIRCIGAEGLPEFETLEQTIAGDETARQLFELGRRTVSDPVFPESLRAVRIMTASNLCGTDADIIAVMGAVDGFFPARDVFEVVSTDAKRTRLMDEERRAFYSAVSKATRLLVISTFSKADLELAEQSKMQVARVRSEHDERIALLRPSCFLAEADAAYPGAAGGQQLLAELGLN